MSADPITFAQPAPAEGAPVRLLDQDPDLARHFTAAELPAASAAVTAVARTLAPGPWTAPPRRAPGTMGLLVLDGTMLREVTLGGRACAHLIGPGDVVDPWMQSEVLAAAPATYTVLEETRVAILNARVAKAAAAFPQLMPALVERLVRQNEHMTALYALALLPRVDTRIVAFFWHLAQRFGRVSRDGVIIPLPLTHRTLGELVGGRRPTVSVALTELEAAGHLRRRPDGSWALSLESWTLLSDSPCPIGPSPVLSQS